MKGNPMMSPKDRYRNDPVFRNLVDVMQSLLEDNACRQYTPTELREAVMLAASMYECRNIQPILIQDGEISYELSHEASARKIALPPIFGPRSGRVRVKQGWRNAHNAGREGTRLGFDVMCGQSWTPVLWDGEEDPDFHKSAGIENI
jgi:hypothetical protein